MDKIRSLKNILVAIIFKFVLLLLGILTIRYLIFYTGNEVNGLNSLFKSIVGFLSIADIGIGTAIAYCMYVPIVSNDIDTIAAVYKLLKKIYIIIGIVIFCMGLVVMPFLPYLAKDYSVDISIYKTFLLMMISVVISYLFSAQSSLINAYKNNYITTTISSLGMILQQVLQIVSLILFRSFVIFLWCRIFAVSIQWFLTQIYVRRKHQDIILNKNKEIHKDLKSQIVRNIRAMFLHKMGGVLVNSVDSIIISTFCGIVILGKYSNYVSIITSMISLLILFFTPLTSIIGHFFVEGDKKILKKYFNFFHGINYILGVVFFLGYYVVIDDLIKIFYGSDLEIEWMIKLVITINYFIQFLRQSVLLFRDATGTFYYDRWKPFCEGICNVILSILFVFVFPMEFKVIGVLLATIITNLFICHIVEPYILFRHIFKESPKKYYLKNYLSIFIFVLLILFIKFLIKDISNIWMKLLMNGAISILISIISIIMEIVFNEDFRYFLKKIFINLLKKY